MEFRKQLTFVYFPLRHPYDDLGRSDDRVTQPLPLAVCLPRPSFPSSWRSAWPSLILERAEVARRNVHLRIDLYVRRGFDGQSGAGASPLAVWHRATPPVAGFSRPVGDAAEQTSCGRTAVFGAMNISNGDESE